MRSLRALLLRLAGLFARHRTDADLDEELESHLAMHVEDRVRSGMTPEEARRHALIRLGGMTQGRERYRERSRPPLIDTFLQDLRFGLRMLRKNPGFAAVAIITLALGIGANTAIFSVVNGVLFQRLPYSNPERLMSLQSSAPGRTYPQYGWMSPRDFRRLQAENRTFTSLSAWIGYAFNVAGSGEPKFVPAQKVSTEYFATLGVKPALGRDFLPSEQQWGAHRVVILSRGFWHTHFNDDPNVCTRVVRLDGEPYNIVGVMPESFVTHFKPELWVPMAFRPEENLDSEYFLFIVGRLKPNVTRQAASSDLNAIMLDIAQQFLGSKGIGVDVQPLQSFWTDDVRPALLVLLAAVGLVLLIACGNVANLMLARASSRQREIAVRAALGASRMRLVRQLITESILLAFLGGVFGLLLGYFALGLLPLAKDVLPPMTNISLDGRVLFLTVCVSTFTGVLFGLLPAIQSTRARGSSASLRETVRSSTGGGGNAIVRPAVVVSEVALALVLLIGTGLAIKSFQRMLQVDPGFSAQHVLTFEVSLGRSYDPQPDPTRIGPSPRTASFYQEFMERIRRLPGVEAAGATQMLEGGGEVWPKVFVPLDRPLPSTADEAAHVQYRCVGGDLFRALEIRLVKGRLLDDRDRANAPLSVVINETLARKFWPNQNPLGKTVLLDLPQSLTPPNLARLGYHPRAFTIVGVMRDVRYAALDQAPAPLVYASVYQHDSPSNPTFVIRTNRDDDAVMRAIRGELAQIDKDVPIPRVVTMQELVAQTVAQPRLQAVLLGLFGGLALFLTTVGVYGVMSYSVSRRTSEIGIRMALGANRWDVLAMICKQGLRLTAIGLAAGLALALGLTRLMSKILFGISPTDPLTFATVVLLLAAVALLACYLPARRATRVDPMIALRYE